MKPRLLAWASWITFLVSAVSEWGLNIDLPLTPAVWLVIATVVCFTANAPAALTTNSWQANSGKWEIGTNWDHSVPALSSSINLINKIVPAGATRMITIDHATVLSNGVNSCLTISNLTLSGTSLSPQMLLMTNAALTTPLTILNNLTININTGVVISNAALHVEGAHTAAISDDGYLTLLSGTLTATNNFSATDQAIVIGDTGPGNMTVLGGTWQAGPTSVGYHSQGTLTVAGGTNLLSGQLNVGFQPGSDGAVWMTDGQLVVTNANTDVGAFGVGQMTVSNGTWRAQLVVVGYGAPGTLTIAGGTNTLSASLRMGYGNGSGIPGTGVVWVTGGQLVVTNDTTYLGYFDDGVGQMTVSNGTWRARQVSVGFNGGSQGTLTVAGGTNMFSSSLDVGSSTSATGAVWLTGGQLVTTNGVSIGLSGVGQMTVSNGTWQAHAVQVSVNPGSQGTLTAAGGTSSVYSNLTIGNFPCTPTGAVVVAGGNLFVTNSTGSAVLEVRSGTLTLSSGVLVVDTFVLTNACAHFVRTGGTLIINNYPPVLDPAGDVDGDGIPNGYELSHGLDPFNPADASLDNDGDGQSNLAEFLAGTDPNNSASYLHILNLVRQDPDMRITWTGGGGTNYAVQAANGGVDGSFTNNFSTLATVSLTGVGDKTNTYVDTFGATNFPARYYRVRLVP